MILESRLWPFSHYGNKQGLATVFVSESFIITQPRIFFYLLPMVALELWQSWEVATETTMFTNLHLVSDPLRKSLLSPEAITNKLEVHKPCPLARVLLPAHSTDGWTIAKQKYRSHSITMFQKENWITLSSRYLPPPWLTEWNSKLFPALKKHTA